MNRRDLIAFEQHYAAMLRREAKARAKRYPAAAEQLERWARQADERVTAIRNGPLFDQDQAA
jgi:hypothetical protein